MADYSNDYDNSFFAGKMVPTMFFLLFFFVLRKRTGGYHAPKFWICYIESIVTYIILIFVCPILAEHERIMYGLVVWACCVLGAIGTVNHPNINMNEKELKESKVMARYILIIEVVIILLFAFLGMDKINLSFMSAAVILCGGLLGLAKIIKQEV